MPFDMTQWQQGQSGLASELQRRQIEEQMAGPRLQEMLLLNKLKQLSGESESFALQQKQTDEPQRQFSNLVGTYGGNRGADAFVQRQPELAAQLFSEGADQGPPDIRGNAQAAGKLLYNTGPETARKINEQSTIAANQVPLQQALQQSGANAQASGFKQEVPGRIAIAQAGQGASAAEHSATRQSQAAGIAFQNFVTNRAVSEGLPILESTASAVKTEQEARGLINQIAALKAQISHAGSSSSAIGVQMGADPSLSVKLQVLTNEALQRLDNVHRQLFNKYWGKKPDGKSSISPFDFGTMAPENTEGYTP